MLGRNLHLCFSMIKRPLSPQPTTADQDLHRPNPLSSAASPPSVLIKNFNSLYDSSSSSTTTTTTDSESDAAAEISATATPDFAAVFASQRFFFSTPGRSNSIIESAAASEPTAALPESSGERLRDSVAIPTYSPDPYADFRRSMQEMVEARERARDGDVKSNWEYLHELLLCYLALNPKSTHKFIIGAFSDLLVSLMPPLPESVVRRR